MYNKYNQPKGVVLIFTMLAIGVAGFIASLALMRASLSSVSSSYIYSSARQQQSQVQGCLDEVIIQFRRNPNFDTDSISIGDSNCSVNITSLSDEDRDIIVSVEDNCGPKLHAVVNINDFEILSISQK
ncbi:hypothetical protein KJ766_03290 [Patescibacteria group bacterium]|nr:hypothetical protein [Patescibacteria group bacterium]